MLILAVKCLCSTFNISVGDTLSYIACTLDQASASIHLLAEHSTCPGMSTSPSSLPWLFLFLFLSALFRSSQADVGSAAHYSPPYLPTACRGSDPSQFPSSNLFGSAGEGIWDNGAACGRQYLVRCISAPVLGTCVPGKTIQIRIVDRALSSVSRPSRKDTTMALSTTAFAAIANSSAKFVNIEFQQ
ncbi:unnamed protein product [Prunus brigantina]